MTQKAVLVGALDTKGAEFDFVKQALESLGVETFVIDMGVLGTPFFTPDISSAEVAERGGMSLAELQKQNDRGKAISVMMDGVSSIMADLLEQDRIGAVYGMGGTAGTTIGAAAMREVPIGIPKLLVSTVASGNTRPYVGEKDIMMMYSVVDIAGINKLSRRILRNAAYALAGMIQEISREQDDETEKPMLGATMFGVTTPCVTRVRELLEEQGYDVLVFHATGAGGMAMEELIRAGFIKGVADITTTELADELVGGVFSAGPNRLEAAGAAGIPQVVSVGALDMVNFGPPETVPQQFKDRTFYIHNPTTTLMRTTLSENSELGRRIALKLNASQAGTIVIFPQGGVSMLDRTGQAFDGVEERKALLKGIKEHLREDIPLIETEENINDPAVAALIAERLLVMMNK
ncbi:Tm-1-like ATP-binding domain-containing protein [Paenibacillus pasadenensis]|uniref:Tm-1-like ATP-binding domain-containing protein n=1 Tax=Paenibacillus pasadenensis TaxID=217090 RepID=UPI00203C9316|nr:Tm-1-like ATP-binding domain-containing protein [Paenibacillus pasadenensis]